MDKKRGSTPAVQVNVLNWRDIVNIFRDTNQKEPEQEENELSGSKEKKSIVIILVVFLFSGLLFGQVQLKAPGKLRLPGITKDKYYKGVITFTKETITIECDKRLFRTLNQFDTPLKKKLVIPMKEVSRIDFEKYGVLIKPETSLYNRYRNLFHEIRYISLLTMVDKKAIIFLLDDYESITKEDLNNLLSGIQLKRLLLICQSNHIITYFRHAIGKIHYFTLFLLL
ncbi:MAG: hypothetical protein GY757_26960 [bacterium]|nr:hypothetical protein [bacterium]